MNNYGNAFTLKKPMNMMTERAQTACGCSGEDLTGHHSARRSYGGVNQNSSMGNYKVLK